MKSVLVSYLLASVFSGFGLCQQQHVWTDDQMLRALGDHGDRIADLEKLVKTLASEYNTLKQEVTTLSAENELLRNELKNITGSCQHVHSCVTSTYTQPTSDIHSHLHTTAGNHISTPLLNVSPTTIPFTVTTKYSAVSTSDPSTLPTVKHSTIITPQPSTVSTTHDALTSATSTVSTTHNALTSATSTVSTTHNAVTSTTSASKQATLSTASVRESTVTTERQTESTTRTTASTTSTSRVFANCKEALTYHQGNGTYDIRVGNTQLVVSVFCERSNGDEWLVIQRRKDGSVNFNKNWNDYKQGFGSPEGELWLGNENLHRITSSADHTLRIDMDDWGGNHIYAEYEHFQVEDEWNMFSLRVGDYRGTAGDSFHYRDSTLLMHHGMPFSTPDRDQDYSFTNCADKLHSGWWFNSCYSSNLNGRYLASAYGQRMLGETDGEPTLVGTGVEWYPYRHRQYSMRRVEMKLKLATSMLLLG